MGVRRRKKGEKWTDGGGGIGEIEEKIERRRRITTGHVAREKHSTMDESYRVTISRYIIEKNCSQHLIERTLLTDWKK